MSFSDDREGQRRRKVEEDADAADRAPAARRKKRGPAPEVGQALRSAYQRTLDEHVPPEMLDLLGKLG